MKIRKADGWHLLFQLLPTPVDTMAGRHRLPNAVAITQISKPKIKSNLTKIEETRTSFAY